jgi:hypothetical protein
MRHTRSFCVAFVVCFVSELEPRRESPIEKFDHLLAFKHSTVPEVSLNGKVKTIAAKPLVEPLGVHAREERMVTVSGERAAKSPGAKVLENAPHKISSTRMVKGSPKEADRQNAMKTYPEAPHHSSKSLRTPSKPCRTLDARSAKPSPP